MANIKSEVLKSEEWSCDVCGKSLYNPDNNSTQTGIQITIIANPDSDNSFLQKQIGNFILGKSYRACCECWLKSIGFKPKEKE